MFIVRNQKTKGDIITLPSIKILRVNLSHDGVGQIPAKHNPSNPNISLGELNEQNQ